MHFLRTAQRFLHVLADIFWADNFRELPLMAQLCGLIAGGAEDQGALAGVQGLGDFFQGEEAGGVEGGHVAQAQDNHRRQLVQVLGHDRNFVSGAEQERSVDAEDGGVARDVFVLENVHASVFDVVVGDLQDGGGRGDAADEEQRGQNHSGFDGYSKIRENGQGEGDQPNTDVGLGKFEQLRNLAPLAHVVGDDQQDSGQRGHGYVAHQRRGEKKNAEQREGVDHARDRGLRAGTNVGRSAGDGTRRGKSSEHGRHNISYALADELNVGIVAVVAHAIGDYSGHERFDRAEQRYGERRAEHAADQ